MGWLLFFLKIIYHLLSAYDDSSFSRLSNLPFLKLSELQFLFQKQQCIWRFLKEIGVSNIMYLWFQNAWSQQLSCPLPSKLMSICTDYTRNVNCQELQLRNFCTEIFMFPSKLRCFDHFEKIAIQIWKHARDIYYRPIFLKV